jgi:hypothetical protein
MREDRFVASLLHAICDSLQPRHSALTAWPAADTRRFNDHGLPQPGSGLMQARQRRVRAAERRRQDSRCGEPRPLRPAEPEPRYRSVLITWLAICPLVTTVLAAGEPLGLRSLPLVPRSVIMTAMWCRLRSSG